MIIKDDFFEYPDDIRNLALSQSFYKGNEHPYNVGGFPGYRTDYFNNILPGLYNVLITPITSLVDTSNYSEYYLQLCFSYTLENTTLNRHVDFKTGYNGYHKFYAGVTYLNPNPPKNTGTTVLAEEIENVYNRFVMYDAELEHVPTGTFGKTKEDGRMVMTHFLFLK
jgi:hypothetical protein